MLFFIKLFSESAVLLCVPFGCTVRTDNPTELLDDFGYAALAAESTATADGFQEGTTKHARITRTPGLLHPDFRELIALSPAAERGSLGRGAKGERRSFSFVFEC